MSRANVPGDEFETNFSAYAARQLGLLVLGTVLLVLAMFVSIVMGTEAIGAGRSIRVMLYPFLPSHWTSDITTTQVLVLWSLRMPRMLMAAIGGASLALAGTAMQGITRNPLVSPYTIGISPAAAFGASVTIVLGFGLLPGIGPYATVIGAFTAAMICAGLVLGLSALRGVTSTMLVLGGVGLTYLFSALTATVQFIGTEQQLAAIVQWTFGSLNGATWDQLLTVGGVFVVAAPVLFAHAWALNAFAAGGDEVAAALGFHVSRTRISVTIAAVLMTAAFVSFAGVIGFVGLVAPHIARMLIGGDHRTLMPFAALVGATLLVLAELVGRLIFAPVIIPVGIVIAYIGVPLFLHLLLTRRQEHVA